MTTIYIESGILNTMQVRYLYSICVLNFSEDKQSSNSDVDISSVNSSIESSSSSDEYSSFDTFNTKRMNRFDIDTSYYKDIQLKEILSSLSCDVSVFSNNVDVFIYLLGLTIGKCYVGDSRLLTTNRKVHVNKLKDVEFEIPNLVFRTKKNYKKAVYPKRIHSLTIYHCGEFDYLNQFLMNILKQTVINTLSIKWNKEFTDGQAMSIMNTLQCSHVKQLDIVITNHELSCEQILNKLMSVASFSNLLHIDVHMDFNEEIQVIIDRFLPICVINNNQMIGYKNNRENILRKVCIIHSMYQGLTLRNIPIDILRLLFEYM